MLRLLATLNARLAYQRGRALLSVAGIALGVALAFGVQLVNRAAVNELAAAVRSVAGQADLEVRGGRSGFPESLYAELARLQGVSLASPLLDLEVGVAGGERRLRVLGIDVLQAAQMHPQLLGDAPPALRYALLEPDRVLLSASAARALGLKKGDRLALVVGLSQVELEVADVLPEGALRGIAALTDIATAQWRLGRLGELNRVDLRLAPGVEREAVREHIARLLPAGVYVSSVASVEHGSAEPSRAYRVNMNVLALVALFTGASSSSRRRPSKSRGGAASMRCCACWAWSGAAWRGWCCSKPPRSG